MFSICPWAIASTASIYYCRDKNLKLTEIMQLVPNQPANIPNYQLNCEKLVSVPLRIFGFYQFLDFTFFVSSYDIVFPVHLSMHRAFCSWENLLSIDTNHHLTFKIRWLNIFGIRKRPSLYLDLSLPMGNWRNGKKKIYHPKLNYMKLTCGKKCYIYFNFRLKYSGHKIIYSS